MPYQINEDMVDVLRAMKAQLERDGQSTAGAELLLANIRRPSMASQIGDGPRGDMAARATVHPFLKANLAHLSGDYRPGTFIQAIANARSRDAEEQAQGKATLAELGVMFADIPDGSINKATLGDSGATGGYVLPNNLVDTPVLKPAVAEAIYTDGPDPLMRVVGGVAVRGIDIPYRTGAPTRMTFQQWGETKENLDEAYGSYTGYLGTIARVYDVGKQYLRFSGGAAEQDVIDELQKARRLGESFYAIAGAGTGTGSSGDPTTGVYTALVASSPTFTTAFPGASNSTIAGNAAVGLAQGLSALAARSRRATAIVMDAVTYFKLFEQGSDTAGFFLSALLAAGFTMGPDGALSYLGVPLRWDPNFNTNTGTTKAAIAADWKSFKFYRGAEFRIDSTDVAGERWDRNLVGFRGEEEIALHAGAAVATGAAQLITGLVP